MLLFSFWVVLDAYVERQLLWVRLVWGPLCVVVVFFFLGVGGGCECALR